MLTEMEKKTLKAIAQHIVENGKSPSQIEIAKKLKLSRQRIGTLYKQLASKEEIKYKSYVPRSVQIKH